MEAVNGVSEVDKGGPPAPSPLTGCYLLIVVGEPHSKEHKDIILRRIAKGLLSWDVSDCHVDLEKELAIITEQAPEGEDARYGERLIQFASENLVTEILIHPAISTLSQCMKNLLSSFTRHRHIIHAGYTFAANGSWILQDGTYSLTDFSEQFQELEVQRVLRAYDNTITLDIHCSPEGDWTRLPKESFTKNCKVRVNPDDVLTSGSPAIVNFLNYISPFLVTTDIETLLESSDVVGNIRFSHPTLYVFPGGQGDAALFGINGFNMLVDGGFARKACFWDFVRHLDRLDAVLLTRLNNSNVNGISSVLRRKKFNTVYPQVGHFFCNIQERKAILSPDGDKDKDPLLVNLLEEGQDIVNNLRYLHLQPQTCYRDVEPINLYHKVGHGTLDMYVLSPAKESKEVREFIQRWNANDQRLFANQKNGRDFTFPIQNLVSICALLVWQPANANDSITRILFPGSTPQHKIFEGLDRLKQLECIKYPSCSAKTLTPSLIKSKQTKTDRILQDQKEKTKERVVQQAEIKVKTENKVVEENIKNIHTNGIVTDQVINEKIIKKHDSTESEKSGEVKKGEDVKDAAPITNGKPADDKAADKTKPKAKPDQKPKIEPRVTKHTRSIERKPKPLPEKKASPTTPKKTIESKINGDASAKPRLAAKVSPSATPAKSAKEANNRKVFESKYKIPPKREVTKPDKKETKQERKPISRRPKETSPSNKAPESPVKKLNELHKIEARKSKLEKEGTTDSSTVSTPSADADTALKKDLSKLTPEELEQLKDRELAELKEEQEVVKEIEAVFRKSEKKVTDDSDLRKIKSTSVDDKTDGEEYLIIEKEEVEHDSLDEKDTKESETQKHLRDSEESEKQRKLSGEIAADTKEVKEEKDVQVPAEAVKQEDTQPPVPVDEIIKKDEKETSKEPSKEMSKEASATSPDERMDVSSGKKITDRDDEDNKEVNILESQPDEKFSTPIESGATTAPTLPEDERIPLDEIKEDNGDQVIEEKYVKEDTKEKEIPVVQLPPKTTEPAKIPTVVGIRLDKQTPIRDLVKTPDEVADLPVHEEVDIDNYEHYNATQAHPPKQDETKQAETVKEPVKVEQIETETSTKPTEKISEASKEIDKQPDIPKKLELKATEKADDKHIDVEAESHDKVEPEKAVEEEKVTETIVEIDKGKEALEPEIHIKISDEKKPEEVKVVKSEVTETMAITIKEEGKVPEKVEVEKEEPEKEKLDDTKKEDAKPEQLNEEVMKKHAVKEEEAKKIEAIKDQEIVVEEKIEKSDVKLAEEAPKKDEVTLQTKELIEEKLEEKVIEEKEICEIRKEDLKDKDVLVDELPTTTKKHEIETKETAKEDIKKEVGDITEKITEKTSEDKLVKEDEPTTIETQDIQKKETTKEDITKEVDDVPEKITEKTSEDDKLVDEDEPTTIEKQDVEKKETTKEDIEKEVDDVAEKTSEDDKLRKEDEPTTIEKQDIEKKETTKEDIEKDVDDVAEKTSEDDKLVKDVEPTTIEKHDIEKKETTKEKITEKTSEDNKLVTDAEPTTIEKQDIEMKETTKEDTKKEIDDVADKTFEDDKLVKEAESTTLEKQDIEKKETTKDDIKKEVDQVTEKIAKKTSKDDKLLKEAEPTTIEKQDIEEKETTKEDIKKEVDDVAEKTFEDDKLVKEAEPTTLEKQDIEKKETTKENIKKEVDEVTEKIAEKTSEEDKLVEEGESTTIEKQDIEKKGTTKEVDDVTEKVAEKISVDDKLVKEAEPSTIEKQDIEKKETKKEDISKEADIMEKIAEKTPGDKSVKQSEPTTTEKQEIEKKETTKEDIKQEVDDVTEKIPADDKLVKEAEPSTIEKQDIEKKETKKEDISKEADIMEKIAEKTPGDKSVKQSEPTTTEKQEIEKKETTKEDIKKEVDDITEKIAERTAVDDKLIKEIESSTIKNENIEKKETTKDDIKAELDGVAQGEVEDDKVVKEDAPTTIEKYRIEKKETTKEDIEKIENDVTGKIAVKTPEPDKLVKEDEPVDLKKEDIDQMDLNKKEQHFEESSEVVEKIMAVGIEEKDKAKDKVDKSDVKHGEKETKEQVVTEEKISAEVKKDTEQDKIKKPVESIVEEAKENDKIEKLEEKLIEEQLKAETVTEVEKKDVKDIKLPTEPTKQEIDKVKEKTEVPNGEKESQVMDKIQDLQEEVAEVDLKTGDQSKTAAAEYDKTKILLETVIEPKKDIDEKVLVKTEKQDILEKKVESKEEGSEKDKKHEPEKSKEVVIILETETKEKDTMEEEIEKATAKVLESFMDVEDAEKFSKEKSDTKVEEIAKEAIDEQTKEKEEDSKVVKPEKDERDTIQDISTKTEAKILLHEPKDKIEEKTLEPKKELVTVAEDKIKDVDEKEEKSTDAIPKVDDIKDDLLKTKDEEADLGKEQIKDVPATVLDLKLGDLDGKSEIIKEGQKSVVEKSDVKESDILEDTKIATNKIQKPAKTEESKIEKDQELKDLNAEIEKTGTLEQKVTLESSATDKISLEKLEKEKDEVSIIETQTLSSVKEPKDQQEKGETEEVSVVSKEILHEDGKLAKDEQLHEDLAKVEKVEAEYISPKEVETLKDQVKGEILESTVVVEKVKTDKTDSDKEKIDETLPERESAKLSEEGSKEKHEHKAKDDTKNVKLDKQIDSKADLQDDKEVIADKISETAHKDKTLDEEKDIDTKEIQTKEIVNGEKVESKSQEDQSLHKGQKMQEITDLPVSESKPEQKEEIKLQEVSHVEKQLKKKTAEEQEKLVVEKPTDERDCKTDKDTPIEVKHIQKEEFVTLEIARTKTSKDEQLQPSSHESSKDDMSVATCPKKDDIKSEHISLQSDDSDKSPSSLIEASVSQKGAESSLEETVNKTAIQSFHEDSLEISKIDKKLQELKEAAEEDKDQTDKSEQPIKLESQSKSEIDLVGKLDLGRKSPKEREQDVAKIVASVAEVLKSDAPLEEFEGKIPIEINTFSAYTPYTTELRETHITTVESPIREDIIDNIQMRPIEEEKASPRDSISLFLDEERKIASLHTNYDSSEKGESRVSSLLKDSNELIQATSKIISDIKQSSKVDTSEDIIDDIKDPMQDKIAAKDSSATKETDIIDTKASILETSVLGSVDSKTIDFLGDREVTSEIVDETDICDIELDSSIVKAGIKTQPLDLVDDVVKPDSSSGKTSPKPKELSPEVVNAEKSQPSSERSSPDRDSKKGDTGKSRSLSPDLDLGEHRKVSLDEKPVELEKTSPDIKQSRGTSPTLSAKASPEPPKSTTEDLENQLIKTEKPTTEVKAVEKIADNKETKVEETKTIAKDTLDTEKLQIILVDITDTSKDGKSTSELDGKPSPDAKETSDKVSDEKDLSFEKLPTGIKSDVKETHTDVDTTTKLPEIKDQSILKTEDVKISSDTSDATKSQVSELEKSAPKVKEIIDSEHTKGSLEATPATSGKTTPEIKEPPKEIDQSGKASPDVAEKSSISGKVAPESSTKEILEPTKDKLDITKSPMFSGRSTPDIVIEEDDGSIIFSGRSTPDIDFTTDKHTNLPTDTDSKDVAVDTTKQSGTKSTTDLEKSDLESKDSKEEKSPSIASSETAKGVTGTIEKAKVTETEKSPTEKISSDVHHIEKQTKIESSIKIDEVRTSSLSGKSTPEIKETTISSDKITSDAKPKDEKLPSQEDIPVSSASDIKISESTDTQLKAEQTAKVESLAGPSSSSKDSVCEGLSPSKSLIEELEYSRKSTPDIADIEKTKELEESPLLGRTTPPTVPVSPIVKEKQPGLHEQEKTDKKDIPEVSSLRSTEVRSSTPASDDCDISSGQVSRVLTTEEEDEKQIYSDDEDLPGSPLSATSQIAHSISSQYDFEESIRGLPPIDPMSTSFYGVLPDDPVDLSKSVKSGHFMEDPDIDFDKALQEHRQARGTDLSSRTSSSSVSPNHVYELTTAKYSSLVLQDQAEKQKTATSSSGQGKKEDIMTSSFIGTELPSDSKDDPIASWGKPLGLPSPAPINDNKGTPKKERKIPPNVMAKNRLNEDKKLSDSKYDKKGKKIIPVYVDLTYVPHHGNSYYSYVDFFKRIRARYYVFSGIEPSKEVYNALLEAKQTWDDKELEVTIIPTYDTDVLGYWVAENEDLLAKYKIDLSPSASRCTINLQDHETSCSAYRLEFS